LRISKLPDYTPPADRTWAIQSAHSSIAKSTHAAFGIPVHHLASGTPLADRYTASYPAG